MSKKLDIGRMFRVGAAMDAARREHAPQPVAAPRPDVIEMREVAPGTYAPIEHRARKRTKNMGHTLAAIFEELRKA